MVKIFFIFFSLTILFSQQPYDGMTIYSPTSGNGALVTHLVNNDMTTINSWNHTNGAASMPYLLKDSTLIYPYRVSNPSMNSGGVGGGISKYSWEGDLLWSYEFANDIYQHHHDVEPLPNGNILIIVWERKTITQSIAAGRESLNNSLNEIWSEAVLELEPVGLNDVNIVWEWHLWDHLIQDYDPNVDNYGVVSEHPELQDINYGNAGSNQGPGGPNGDWKHFNAIAYNEDLDQIALSSRSHDEIYIIDHSTTTIEAAGHSGGNSGMGGDYLFRWGNPQAYQRGVNSDHLLGDQHGVNWVPEGYPGEGNLIIFNNNYSNNNSAVFEIIPPLNSNGTYDIEGGQPYGPNEPIWIHTGGFHTQMQGGAFRLPNGNTLITDCDDSYIFEVTNNNEVVWSYDNGAGQSFIARAQKYPLDYLGDEFPEYIIGDVNFDQLLDIHDILYISDMSSGYGFNSTPPADFNEDGSVNISDLILLLQSIINN
jgi:hypothetical protein